MGSLFTVGGMDVSTKGPTTVDRFDLRTNTWASVASMTGRRVQFGVSVFDGKIYVVGGVDANSVEMYDPKKRSWAMQCEFEIPRICSAIVKL